jgi:RNA-directed DNA polymerase
MVQAHTGQRHPRDQSRALQRRLSRAAKRRGTRRFHAWYDRIVRPDGRWRAWGEVRAKGGSPGVDGRSLEDVERDGIEASLSQLAADLKAQRDRPSPGLRVEIPKPDGRTRPLGMPSVRDRIVQPACTIVIEPRCEAHVLPCAYGYRPTRRAGQAVLAVQEALVWRWWVLDADMESFFDRVEHEVLRGLVRRRVSDRRVLQRIAPWLRAGVVVDGRRQRTRCGVPQGGVGSRWRSNIYRHTRDRWWQDRHAGVGQLSRYGDACVIVCRSRQAAEQARERVAGFLGRLKLTLHPQKTRVVDLGREGFDCLGFHFQKRPSRRTSRLVPDAWPSQKAMKTVRERIRQQTERPRVRVERGEVVGALNRILRGWRAYCSIGHATPQLADLDRYVRLRLWRFLRQRQGPRGRLRPAAFAAWERRSGLTYFYPTGRRAVPTCTP